MNVVLPSRNLMLKIILRYMIPWLLVFSLCFHPTASSQGDSDPNFRYCVSQCYDINDCKNVIDYESAKKRIRGEPLWYLKPLTSYYTHSCLDDCKFDCMNSITATRISKGGQVLKYYGHWPFERYFGMEEPASVLFSLLNAVPHAVHLMYWATMRITSLYVTSGDDKGLKRESLQEGMRETTNPTYFMRQWLQPLPYVSLSAWLLSAQFHAKKTPTTSILDYIGALVLISYSLWVTLRRFWGPSANPLAVTSVFTMGVLACGYRIREMLKGNISFDQHMFAAISMAVIHVIVWIVWMLRNYLNPPQGRRRRGGRGGHDKKSIDTIKKNTTTRQQNKTPQNEIQIDYLYSYLYHHECSQRICFWVQVIFSIAGMMEIFDFPPLFGIFDAHSLWHACTVPLGFAWYSFWASDCRAEYYRTGETKEKPN